MSGESELPRYITYSDSRGFGPVRCSREAAAQDGGAAYAVDADGCLRDESGALVYSSFACSAPGILLRINKDAIASNDGAYDKMHDATRIEDASNLVPVRLPDGFWHYKIWGSPVGPFNTLHEVEHAIRRAVRDDELKRTNQHVRDSRNPAWLGVLLDLVLMLLLVLIGFQVFKWLK